MAGGVASCRSYFTVKVTRLSYLSPYPPNTHIPHTTPFFTPSTPSPFTLQPLIPTSFSSSHPTPQGKNESPTHPNPYTCDGHAGGDPVLPAPLTALTDALQEVADLDGNGVITNYEMYQALDPTVAHYNDYVFDHFRWDHCSSSV